MLDAIFYRTRYPVVKGVIRLAHMRARSVLEHFVAHAPGAKISEFNLVDFKSRDSIHATVKILDFSQ